MNMRSFHSPSPHLLPRVWRKSPFSSIGVALGMVLVLLLFSGCAAEQTAAPTVAPTEVPTKAPTQPLPTATLSPVDPTAEVVEPVIEIPGITKDSPEYTVVLASWEEGVHGKTYDLGKGPNTYCSRCHSPQNWDPASTTDKPPSCVTCKFPTDPELRIASTMDFVEEMDWKGIGCETCHVAEGDFIQAEVAWLNPISMEHETLATPNELCAKCHADTKGVSASGGRGVEHGIVLGGSAHLNWGGALPQERRPEYCSECHDPHSGEPKQCLDCHEDVIGMETHQKGSQAEHANVTCMACHDASGLDVAPFPAGEENAEWTTILSSVSRSGETVTEYVHSHSIQWLVDCSRCHYEGNPFDLSVLTADGQPPSEGSN